MARILIIENEPNIAMVLEEILSEEGYEISTAPNGIAGLERLGQIPLPEIVVTDLFMPGLTGKVIVETMRLDPKLRDIPVIIITGSLPSEKDFPPEGSYQVIMSKPFDLFELLRVVKSLLETKG